MELRDTNQKLLPRAGKWRAVITGYGLDDDGHFRLTTGDGFRLVGGSESSHKAMSGIMDHIQSELARQGLALDRLTREQAEEVNRMLESMGDRA